MKGNQPALYAQLKALPWTEIPIVHTQRKPSPRPHRAAQHQSRHHPHRDPVPTRPTGLQIARKTRKLRSNKWTTEIAYAITSLSAEQATTRTLAAWVPGHWCNENRLHWVRDVTLNEDRSQARTGNGPRVMASLHNLTISILRLDGATNIAQALRHHAWNPLQTVKLLLTQLSDFAETVK